MRSPLYDDFDNDDDYERAADDYFAAYHLDHAAYHDHDGATLHYDYGSAFWSVDRGLLHG